MRRSSTAARPDPGAAGLVTPDGLTRGAFPAMGTTVDVLVPEPDGALIGEVQALFETWERTLTRFSPESELSRLNRSPGRDVRVSELHFSVVQAALDAAADTDGIFDPTMLRQLEALGYDRTFAHVSSREANRSRRSRQSAPRPGGAWRDVVLDPAGPTVRLPEGAALDLGGIAKGMAVDAAIAFLGKADCRCAAVNAGGDLAVLGLPNHEDGWPVLIELPGGARPDGRRLDDRWLAGGWSGSGMKASGRVLRLAGGALATSGVSRRHWRSHGRDVHHLLDPRTGLSAASGLWSATTVGDSCRAAEIAATTAFVLGPAHGARWLADRDIDGLLVLPDGTQIEVGGWGATPEPDAAFTTPTHGRP